MNPEEAKKQFPKIWEKALDHIVGGWIGYDGGTPDEAAELFIECTEQELDIDMDKLAAALEIDAWGGMGAEERAIYNRLEKLDNDAHAYAHGEL